MTAFLNESYSTCSFYPHFFLMAQSSFKIDYTKCHHVFKIFSREIPEKNKNLSCLSLRYHFATFMLRWRNVDRNCLIECSFCLYGLEICCSLFSRCCSMVNFKCQNSFSTHQWWSSEYNYLSSKSLAVPKILLFSKPHISLSSSNKMHLIP